jgi:hypothetical protein
VLASPYTAWKTYPTHWMQIVLAPSISYTKAPKPTRQLSLAYPGLFTCT